MLNLAIITNLIFRKNFLVREFNYYNYYLLMMFNFLLISTYHKFKIYIFLNNKVNHISNYTKFLNIITRSHFIKSFLNLNISCYISNKDLFVLLIPLPFNLNYKFIIINH